MPVNKKYSFKEKDLRKRLTKQLWQPDLQTFFEIEFFWFIKRDKERESENKILS